MITDKLKANAIALMKMGDTPRKVSEDLELPYMLCKQWAEELGLNDLTAIEARAIGLAKALDGEIMNSSQQNVEILKAKIEETAIHIIDKAREYVHFPDLPSAKALELLSNTCTKLYLTIVSKQTVNDQTPQGMTLLEQLGKD